jgi:hypothetical protein
VQAATGPQVHPLERLDVELWSGGERLGLLARLRDLLPGRVAIGLAGRDPDGNRLPPGKYRIRLLATPANNAQASSRIVTFRIK